MAARQVPANFEQTMELATLQLLPCSERLLSLCGGKKMISLRLNTRILAGVAAAAFTAFSLPAMAAGKDDRAITIATPFTFDNIDSCNSSSEVGLIIRENVVEGLTHLDEATGRPKPRLAFSLVIRPAPTTWRDQAAPRT